MGKKGGGGSISCALAMLPAPPNYKLGSEDKLDWRAMATFLRKIAPSSSWEK